MNNSNIFEEDFSFEDSKTTETEEKIDIFASSSEEPKVEDDIKKLKQIEHDKKIERIQVYLILFLVVVGSLVYFFGYDFLKPFIKVD